MLKKVEERKLKNNENSFEKNYLFNNLVDLINIMSTVDINSSGAKENELSIEGRNGERILL